MAGEAADGVEEAGRNDAEARFRARQVKRTDGFKAGKIPTEGGEFILDPERKFLAVTPEIEGAKAEKKIAQASQQTKC